MADAELEQRRRQARATTFRQRLEWLDQALRLARALQRPGAGAAPHREPEGPPTPAGEGDGDLER